MLAHAAPMPVCSIQSALQGIEAFTVTDTMSMLSHSQLVHEQPLGNRLVVPHILVEDIRTSILKDKNHHPRPSFQAAVPSASLSAKQVNLGPQPGLAIQSIAAIPVTSTARPGVHYVAKHELREPLTPLKRDQGNGHQTLQVSKLLQKVPTGQINEDLVRVSL